MFARIAFLVCLVAGLSAQQPPARISGYDRGVSVNMLKQIKRDLKDNYYDTAFRGMDVEKTFTEAEDRLRAANSVSEATAIIADVLMRLNDSHTVFYPPERVARVKYGWHATMIGDLPYVTGVVPGSDAEKKGVAVGDRVLTWNRFEPTRENLWQISYLYTFVRPQVLQRVIVRKPDGVEKAIDVQSQIEEHPMAQLEDLLDELAAGMRPSADVNKAAGDTLVWKYSGFGDPKAVERVMKKARDYTSLVIDLRGNGGGAEETMRTLIASLFDRDVQVVTTHTRKGDEPLVAKGRKDAFAGKLVLLVDSRSASASEIVARVAQLEKRGTVVGDRSAGAVMRARFFPHTVGLGSIAFYAVSVTIGDARMADGGTLEKVGVTPDETVLPTGADLAAGRDPVLARAITLLGGTMTAEQAGKFYRQ
jgi:carboxyl-terminal processing protease